MRKADAATLGAWARGLLMVVGLSYHTTSLEKREQLAPISEQRGTAQKPTPGVLLATCNRIELYSWVTGRRGRSAGGQFALRAVPIQLIVHESVLTHRARTLSRFDLRN